jgi:hypothetical protein
MTLAGSAGRARTDECCGDTLPAGSIAEWAGADSPSVFESLGSADRLVVEVGGAPCGRVSGGREDFLPGVSTLRGRTRISAPPSPDLGCAMLDSVVAIRSTGASGGVSDKIEVTRA